MAVKTRARAYARERGHHKRTHGISSDEISLRDEILELKRQVVRLKRTNEQNLVKFRKYEDEAKRKDRQIEQLMDPRKNADITKVLSTKGAAILMTLKDQNNSLIQMVLNKDLQIRKLASEIKMSKLYASSKKNEPLRGEVNRLRTLLMRSQEMVRENADQEQSRAFHKNPFFEVSSSSDQSSPRDLVELRSTIQSLETHIKYSNELLAKKNQEISALTDELNTLRKFFLSKVSKKKQKKTYDYDEFFDAHDFSRNEWPEQIFSKTTKLTDQLLGEVGETTEKPLPSSAPASVTKWTSSRESTPKHTPMSNIFNNCNWNELQTDDERKKEIVNDAEEKPPSVGGRGGEAREKWKRALVKLKQFKAQNSGNVGAQDEGKTRGEEGKRKNETPSDVSDLETHEFELMEKEIQNDQMGLEKILKFQETRYCNAITETELKEKNSGETESSSEKENVSHLTEVGKKEETTTTDSRQSPGKNSITSDTTELMTDEIQNIKKEIHNMAPTFSLDVQKELFSLYRSISTYEEIEMKRANYRRSLDSSLESENSSAKQIHVQVEVQINSVPVECDSDGCSISENNQLYEFHTAENCAIEDGNDDDDVVIR